MNIINFTVNQQDISRDGGVFRYASDTIEYIKATFDTDWNVDVIRAIWSNNGTDIAVEVADGECVIPPEVLTKAGNVTVNLVGSVYEGDELKARITTYPITALIVTKTKIEGANSIVTPTEYEAFVAQVHTDAGIAQEAGAAAVEAAEAAIKAAGDAVKVGEMTVSAETLEPGSEATVTKTTEEEGFHLTFGIPAGEDGKDGAPGKDGSDGVDGKDGKDGIDGKDGLDGSDGQDGTTFTPNVSIAGVLSWTNDGGKQNPPSVDIVAAVLSALPVWNGGTY